MQNLSTYTAEGTQTATKITHNRENKWTHGGEYIP